MGLDSFKSEASSTTRQKSSSSKGRSLELKSPEDAIPYFCAVIVDETESVRCYKGIEAFREAERFGEETFLGCIETKDQFEQLNEMSIDLHGCGLEKLFERDPVKASDFMNRLSPNSTDDIKQECAVCDEDILITDDKYTKVEGELVHSHHTVSEVTAEMSIGV